MKNPENLLFVRHGESSLNAWHNLLHASDTYKKFQQEYTKNPDSNQTFFLASYLKDIYGSFVADHESKLNFLGRKQSRAIGYALMKEKALPDIIYSSPYKRTVETVKEMRKVWPQLKQVPVILDFKLREQEVGEVSLYGDFDLFFALNPEQKELFEIQGLFHYRFPHGENAIDILQRLEVWYQDIRKKHHGKKIMVISHFITILAMRAYFENWNDEKFLNTNSSTPKINCAVTEFKKKAKKLELVRFNAKLW